MKRLTLIFIAIMAMASPARAAGLFVKGLDSYVLYSAEQDLATLAFNINGQSFNAIALWNEGSVTVAVDGPSGRNVVYRDGAPLSVQSVQKIGFNGTRESRSNEYVIGTHDFTNDGCPELVVAVNDGGDGTRIFILKYEAGGWRLIGNMYSKGKGLGGCRVFRQALTMKDTSGVLYTWTCHGDKFDFLSSDKFNDESRLY